MWRIGAKFGVGSRPLLNVCLTATHKEEESRQAREAVELQDEVLHWDWSCFMLYWNQRGWSASCAFLVPGLVVVWWWSKCVQWARQMKKNLAFFASYYLKSEQLPDSCLPLFLVDILGPGFQFMCCHVSVIEPLSRMITNFYMLASCLQR